MKKNDTFIPPIIGTASVPLPIAGPGSFEITKYGLEVGGAKFQTGLSWFTAITTTSVGTTLALTVGKLFGWQSETLTNSIAMAIGFGIVGLSIGNIAFKKGKPMQYEIPRTPTARVNGAANDTRAMDIAFKHTSIPVQLLAALILTLLIGNPVEAVSPIYTTDIGVDVRDETAPILCENGTVVVFGNSRLHFLSASNLTLKSSLYLGYASEEFALGSPVVGHDGYIYMGLNGYNEDNFFAVDPKNQTVLWRRTLEGRVTVTPAMSPDGTLVVVHGNTLSGLNPRDGTIVWNKAFSNIATAPVVTRNGVVYVCVNQAGHRGVLAYSPTADAVLWSALVDEQMIERPPAIGADGRVILVTRGGYLWGFAADGAPLWSATYVGGTYPQSPTIADDGTILVTRLNNVMAFDSKGNLEWTQTTAKNIVGSLAVGDDGKAYAVAGRYLYCYSIADGSSSVCVDVGAVAGAQESTPLLTSRGYAVFARNTLAYAVAVTSKWSTTSPWSSAYGGPRACGMQAPNAETAQLNIHRSADGAKVVIGLLCPPQTPFIIQAHNTLSEPGQIVRSGSTENGVLNVEVPIASIPSRFFTVSGR